MLLFFFLAPYAIGLIGGLIGGLVVTKIIDLIFINFLTLDISKSIAREKLPYSNLIKVLLKDPNNYNECNIGLYNTKTEILEECIEVEYSEMESSLKKKLQSNNNLLILN
ncbi:hypothetical protein [Winogradskyella undariae]|jgi:hypothetical protein|uniref:hypothetical protein n=1 Tax=Winogradskyella undariae TaxID=1285465 RepID=UPI0015C958F8|nr:hypothetical protein [Winogradskyella undariae]